MIKLNPDPTFEAMVKLSVPGQPETVDVPMTFRHMAGDKVAEWFKKNEKKQSADALNEIIEGWTGVIGADGKVVPYTKKALETLLKNYRPATVEIIRAWQKELQESRLKN